jgi:hypothetical protein
MQKTVNPSYCDYRKEYCELFLALEKIIFYVTWAVMHDFATFSIQLISLA